MVVFEVGEALAEVLEDVVDLIGGDEAILVLVEDVEGRRWPGAYGASGGSGTPGTQWHHCRRHPSLFTISCNSSSVGICPVNA